MRSFRPTTTIHLDGAVNARDLGGLPLVGGGHVPPGVLVRCDNLQDLTPGDVETLVDRVGVRSVVDLRTGYERRSEGPGPLEQEPRVRIEHRSLYPETGGGTDLDLTTIVPWGDGQGADLPDETPTVRAYLGYLERRPDSIVGALRTVARTEGATLVHCAAGKDRTGIVVALALAAAGVERTSIADDYVATAGNIEAIVARLAASPTYAAEIRVEDAQVHAPRAGTMERVFELLDDLHGGPLEWLDTHGFDDSDLVILRERLGAG